MTHVLLIGNGAREHAIAEALMRSGRNPRLFAYMKTNNPGIASLATEVRIGSYNDPEAVIAFAKEAQIDFAVIGPEDPLSHGIVDELAAAGIPAVGPTRTLARLETSKSFTRISSKNTASPEIHASETLHPLTASRSSVTNSTASSSNRTA